MSASVPEATLRSLALYSGEGWDHGNVYHAHAEKAMQWSWDNTIWPFIHDCDFSHTLDLACGGGRNSAKLIPLATTHRAIDILASNVEGCRQRFKDHSNVQFFVCNGYDLSPVTDGELTLVYCFDAMVHFDSDVVRSYLRDTFRVLRQSGRGFFHHSALPLGPDWKQNPHGRAFMTPELFAHYARKEGLIIARQQVIDWGGGGAERVINSDCLSLVVKSE
jgi:SAM-dependent methyltransferase